MANPHELERADAVVINDKRIVFVGQMEIARAIAGMAGKNVKVIDAQGRLLLPGFNDAHVHFMDGGFSLANVNLRDADSPQEFSWRIAAHAQTLPAGKWITGGEWDHEQWPGAPLPSRDWIDCITPEHPVFVSRSDGHMALANSLALKLARITKQTSDVPGGLIMRDENGEPTGLLKDAAMNAVFRAMPKRDDRERTLAARRATDYAASLGVTSVHDILAGDDAGIYAELAHAGQLKTRIYGFYPIARWAEPIRQCDWLPDPTGLVRIGGVKGFTDGSLGSGTAWFFEPYADDPENFGLPGEGMFPEGAMLERVMEADKRGLQVALHAIGDRANFEALEIFKNVAERNGIRERRFRIEHAQHLRPSEIPRFAEQHVIASVQPYHAVDDGRWCEARLGPKRLAGTYAFRSLLDTSAILALGTDWTVGPLNPMLTIAAAVTRSTLDGKNPNGWLPGEKITVEEAVRAYTMGSAYAEFAERDKGSIVPGKFADLVLLDKNIFEIPPSEIFRVHVSLTMVGGEVVFEM